MRVARLRRSAAFVVLLSATTFLTAMEAPAAQAADPCAGWTTSVLASGLGQVENLLPDGVGGLYLSVGDRGVVLHSSASGQITTLAAGIPGAAGLRRTGDYLYVNQGNTQLANLGVPPAGRLLRIDLRTGERVVVASGVQAPNGLVRLPDGSLLVSSLAPSLGGDGISRYDPAAGTFEKRWLPIEYGNGMVVAPDGRSVYVNRTFLGDVVRVPLVGARTPVRVAALPGVLPAPDDLDADAAGKLYTATYVEGAVRRVDPATGDSCVITKGISQPTAVKVVAEGGSAVLYSTSYGGALRRITPPAGYPLQVSPAA